MPLTHSTTQRAARQRRPTATDRRAQILREAIRCFAAAGFRGTTTRKIAESVGITEAALYRYFPSKQSLYDAIIDEKISAPPVQDMVAENLAQQDDHAIFSSLAHALLKRGLEDPDFIRLFYFTALEGHAFSAAFFTSRIGGLRSFVTEHIASRMEEGAFRKGDPALCARAFLGMIMDYLNVRVILAQNEAYPQSIDEVVATFVEIFLAGIRIEDPDREGNRP